MKISELIEELNRLKDEHGDLEVKVWKDEDSESIGEVSKYTDYDFSNPFPIILIR